MWHTIFLALVVVFLVLEGFSVEVSRVKWWAFALACLVIALYIVK